MNVTLLEKGHLATSRFLVVVGATVVALDRSFDAGDAEEELLHWAARKRKNSNAAIAAIPAKAKVRMEERNRSIPPSMSVPDAFRSFIVVLYFTNGILNMGKF